MRRVLADAEHALADASDGMGRIHAVAADLRTFSRPDGADDDEHVWLDAVVQSACNLAQPLLRNTVALELDLCGKAGVNGNRGRLGQVVTNLVVNAAQAVAGPAARGNQVRIETRALGEQVMLAVEDAGPGIPEAIRARVFEPFFTTKSAEQGTGLGLSLVAEIVQRSGGTVSVSSGRLGGARFEVLLPAAIAPARVEPVEPELPAASRRGRVLIIDDEPRLLQTYGLVLGADHEVCLVGSGAEAIALLERDRRFDFVLCDLQMPGVSGVEVYERLRAIAPELVPRLVFSTGGVFQPRVKEFLDRTRVDVVEKPVRVETLLARIARALDARLRLRLRRARFLLEPLRDHRVAEALDVGEPGGGVLHVAAGAGGVPLHVEPGEAAVEDRALAVLVGERGDEVSRRAVEQRGELRRGRDRRDRDALVEVLEPGGEQVTAEQPGLARLLLQPDGLVADQVARHLRAEQRLGDGVRVRVVRLVVAPDVDAVAGVEELPDHREVRAG